MFEEIIEGKWDKVKERLGKGIPISFLSYVQKKLNEGIRQAIKDIRNQGKENKKKR